MCKARFQKVKGLVAPAKPTQPGWTAYKDMQRHIYREFLYKIVNNIKRKGATLFAEKLYSAMLKTCDYLHADKLKIKSNCSVP